MTERREHVFALLRLGYTRGQIADELDISVETVRRHVRALCRDNDLDVAGLREMPLDVEPEEA